MRASHPSKPISNIPNSAITTPMIRKTESFLCTFFLTRRLEGRGACSLNCRNRCSGCKACDSPPFPGLYTRELDQREHRLEAYALVPVAITTRETSTSSRTELERSCVRFHQKIAREGGPFCQLDKPFDGEVTQSKGQCSHRALFHFRGTFPYSARAAGVARREPGTAATRCVVKLPVR